MSATFSGGQTLLPEIDGGFARLDGVGILTVSGPDRVSFLQSFCTQDVRDIPTGQGREAFITSPQGKILCHVYVLNCDATLRLVAIGSDLKEIRQHLDRYIIREAVELKIDSDRYLAVGVTGTWLSSRGLDGVLAHQHFPTTSQAISPESIAAPMVWLIRLPTAAPCALALAEMDRNTLHRELVAWVGESRFCEHPWAVWESARISAGLPINGVDITRDHLPQEIGRDQQAISFHKGCYLGQETIARIDALGHVNWNLVFLVSRQTPPPPGTEITTYSCRTSESHAPTSNERKVVGRITSVGTSEIRGCTVALGYVRREFARPGTSLVWEFGEFTISEMGRYVSSPRTQAEMQAALDLRYRVLREPWGQPPGSEQDPMDTEAFHLTVMAPCGRLLGTGRLHWNSDAEAQIRYMAVEENARGRNVGRDLVWGLEAAARRSNVKSIVLQAREDVEGFYRKLGYRTIGPGPTLFETVRHVKMQKDLHASAASF